MESHIQPWVKVQMSARGVLGRRGFLRLAGGGALGLAGLDWLAQLSRSADELRRQGKSCILLWMAGGPSQFESLDPKPGAETQGPTLAISTAIPGTQISQHWPKLATVINEMTMIRSMTSREGNHGRATYLLHTSYNPSGGIVHP